MIKARIGRATGRCSRREIDSLRSLQSKIRVVEPVPRDVTRRDRTTIGEVDRQIREPAAAGGIRQHRNPRVSCWRVEIQRPFRLPRRAVEDQRVICRVGLKLKRRVIPDGTDETSAPRQSQRFARQTVLVKRQILAGIKLHCHPHVRRAGRHAFDHDIAIEAGDGNRRHVRAYRNGGNMTHSQSRNDAAKKARQVQQWHGIIFTLGIG